MAGSIRQKKGRPADYWELRVYRGRDPATGKPDYATRVFRGGQRAASKALSSFVAELEANGETSSNASVAFLISKWLQVRIAEGAAPSTIETYENYIRNWVLPAIGLKPIRELTSGDLRTLYGEMNRAGVKRSGIDQVRAIVSAALTFGQQNEWVTQNVARLNRPTSEARKQEREATREEWEALLAEAHARRFGLAVETMIAIAPSMGGRVGEMCALRHSDVAVAYIENENRGKQRAAIVSVTKSAYKVRGEPVSLKDTKNHQIRTVPLLDRSLTALEALMVHQRDEARRFGVEMVEDPYVFSRMLDGSGPPPPRGYSSSMCRLRDYLAKKDERVADYHDSPWRDIHFHSLRHTFGSELVRLGTPLPTVQQMMGHKSIATTGRYTHSNAADQMAAATLLAGRLAAPTPALPAPSRPATSRETQNGPRAPSPKRQSPRAD